MFGFIKKVFFTAMAFFNSTVLNVYSLECVSMNNEECKARPKLIDINNNEPMCYPLVLTWISVVEVVTISAIHMLNCVFQMLLKTQM